MPYAVAGFSLEAYQPILRANNKAVETINGRAAMVGDWAGGVTVTSCGCQARCVAGHAYVTLRTVVSRSHPAR